MSGIRLKAETVTQLDGVLQRLHHVGFVVASIDASMPGFVRSLGGTWNGDVIVDPIQNVKVAFLVLGPNEAQVELVQAHLDPAPVTKFLKDKGEGLHHMCFEVKDLEVALSTAKSNGGLLVKKPKPAVAFGGRRIAWVLTREKLLVEFLELG
jgi:methylmalonyl-CoA/ethylmalonyl-CoA epimerase